LNIIFATGLMLGMTCSGIYLAVIPTLLKFSADAQAKVTASVEQRRQAELKQFVDAEKAAKTDEEKEAVRAQRREVELRPKTVMPGGTIDISKMGLSDPKVVSYYWVDLLTGMLLNLGMLIAGIGLVRLRPWALKLATWVAIAKIIRLFLVYSFFTVMIAPKLSHGGVQMIMAMSAAPQAKPSPKVAAAADDLELAYLRLYRAYAIGAIALGSIYPVVLIWLLNNPGARAACSGRKRPQAVGEP